MKLLSALFIPALPLIASAIRFNPLPRHADPQHPNQHQGNQHHPEEHHPEQHEPFHGNRPVVKTRTRVTTVTSGIITTLTITETASTTILPSIPSTPSVAFLAQYTTLD
jgi:hypothetical protein